eukprot:m.1002283 g.1002283  ORF g.1002283 m.1002283 type:complete len:646 (-) comp24035_c0_seq5:4476-6413(-)
MDRHSRLGEFADTNFDPRQYVKLVANGNVSRKQIKEQHELIKSLSSRTAEDLKLNVFKNYPRYIDAAKAISKFEAELEQLKDGLTEEQDIIERLDTLFTTGSAPGIQQKWDDRGRLQQVKSLDRNNPLLAGECVFQGRFTVLDVVTHEPRGQAHGFLMTNSLVIALHPDPRSQFAVSKRARGGGDLVLDSVDPLSTLNVTDLDSVKNAVLIEGATKASILVYTSGRDKRAWLVALRRAAANVKGIAPTGDSEAAVDTDEEWLREVPEELDVCVAQRDFQRAVELAVRAQTELSRAHGTSRAREDLKDLVRDKVTVLTRALCAELRRPAIRRNAIRANLKFLLDLGEGDRAHQVYLQNRSEAIRVNFRKLKMEGSTELYVLKLARNFFSTLRSACIEFDDLFDAADTSAFMAWATRELEHFAMNFSDQVLQSLTKFPTVAQCINKVMEQCDQLQNHGLDLGFVLWRMLEPRTLDAIEDAGIALVGSTSTDLDIETWAPQRFSGNHAKKQFVDRMIACDFDDVETYIQGKDCVLFEATTNFITRVHEYRKCALLLLHLELSELLFKWLNEVFMIFMKWLVRSCGDASSADSKEMFAKNAEVLLWLLGATKERLEEPLGATSPLLENLVVEATALWQRGLTDDGVSYV